jgi:hypothetical protein
MAFLKVIFPHRDDNGRFYAAGDYREVPDHLTEVYTRPYPGIGFVVMAADERTQVSEKAKAYHQESSLEQLKQQYSPPVEEVVEPLPEKVEEKEPEQEEVVEVVENRGRKRKV